jgi:CheY-like chemotaxis protein
MDAKPIRCAWVVDDDPLQVLILNRLLASHQAVKSTKFFSGAKSAIEALVAGKSKQDELPDLIFLDLIMSKGDGWEFLDYYKKNKSKLPRQARIIVISASNEANNKRVLQYQEVVDFLPKPIDKKDFEDLMESLIANTFNTSSKAQAG